MMERSTVQRIGDVEQMVTSLRRHLRAENKAEQTITANTYAPLQFADFLADRGMPSEVVNIRREHVEAFLEDLLGRPERGDREQPLPGARRLLHVPHRREGDRL
jgi:hypothetical protein